MILTVTPNPSIDLLFTAERLVWDDANRLDTPRRRAGGQGINLARAAATLGGAARAVAMLGGASGAELRGLLEAMSLPFDAVAIAGETRVFVGVREGATHRSLTLNSRGPATGGEDAERLLGATEAAVATHRPRWLVCSGSLPPGMPDHVYARMTSIARAHRARYVVDCDGAALRLAASTGCDVLSPNAAEAERLLGVAPGSLAGERDAAAAALEMRARFGVRVAFVTLGVAGAVGADGDGAWHVAAPEADPGTSAVGAGDAFLAAALLALDDGARAELATRAGVAAGSAVLRSRGSALLERVDYDDLLKKTNARRIV